MKRKLHNGFTLMEVLVVMSLLAIISSLALMMNLGDYRAYMFRNEVDLVVSILQKARSQAVNNICEGGSCTDGKPHGVHFGANSYILFQASSTNMTYAARDVGQDQPIERNTNVLFSPASPADVVFSQLSASTTAWSLNLSDSFGHGATVSINPQGRIDW